MKLAAESKLARGSEVYDNYLAILKAELLPAMGCTEPIAVAFAAAKARAVLGKMPERIVMYCSGNIIKNVKSVVVPNSGGQIGINAAAVLGSVAGREELELEVLNSVTAGQIEKARSLAAIPGYCECRLVEGEENLYIRAEVFSGHDCSSVEIKTKHNHISRIEKNGVLLFEQPELKTGSLGDKSKLNIKDIYEFANCVELADIEDLLKRQLKYNEMISNEGLTNSWGSSIGKTLLESHANPDFFIRAKAKAAAGSDARMAGCALPVVINSGSGNQGITVSMPLLEYAREVNCSEEKLLRALCLANLISLHQKYYIGNLSAYCGATSAGCSAVCGMAYIDGADMETLGWIVVNAINTIGGMVCDGAKSSCAAKIASAVEASLLAYELVKRDRSFKPGEGMVDADIEKSIENVGRMGRVGMASTDVEILNILLENTNTVREAVPL